MDDDRGPGIAIGVALLIGTGTTIFVISRILELLIRMVIGALVAVNCCRAKTAAKHSRCYIAD